MSSEIFVREGPGETRYAMTVNGVLTRQFIYRAENFGSVGGVYKGRIIKIHPGLNAAFVNLGLEKEGFLPAANAQIFDPARDKSKSISDLFSEGQTVLVQIQREGDGEKGPRLTTRINVTSHHFVLTPSQPGIFLSKKIRDENDRTRLQECVSGKLPPDCGIVIRSGAPEAAEPHLLQELDQLSRNWSAALDVNATSRSPSLVMNPTPPLLHLLSLADGTCDRIVANTKSLQRLLSALVENLHPELAGKVELYSESGDIFNVYDLLDQWAELYERSVILPSGGRLLIDETAAVTAIDVDSGGGLPSRRGEDFSLATNLEAAAEIGRQILLKELAGQIVIDFLPLRRAADQNSVKTILTKSLVSGGRDIYFFGFSAMGLFELTRRRRWKSFNELNLTKGPSGRRSSSLAYDILYRLKNEDAIHPGRVVCIKCSYDVAILLRQGKLAHYLVEIEKQIGSPVEFETESRHDCDTFDLSLTS